MERMLFQRTWYGINLAEVTGSSHFNVISRQFYSAFYESLLFQNTEKLKFWEEEKNNIVQWIMTMFLKSLGDPKEIRVLSLGAGLGITEGKLSEHSYQCDALEYDLNLIRWVKKYFPRVKVFVGDCLDLPCKAESYHLVLMSNVDYCFRRDQYLKVLLQIKSILKPGGIFVCMCASNLSLNTLVRSFLKTMLLNATPKSRDSHRGVLWGYSRTVGEHIALGRRAGLNCGSVCLLDKKFRVRSIRNRHSPFLEFPTILDHTVVVAFGKASK